ncbi:hypothetical protein C8R46DRAFT_1112670 [Mycena filopes]|nr:hypothetical protein C8R46DRAFT_1112670 [Mycena filopes]
MPVLITGNNAVAPIVSFGLGGILYGFSVCMFGLTVWVLLFQRRGGKVNTPMIIVACIMWFFSTTRMIIDISRTVEAFTNHISTPTAPEEFLSNFSGSVSLLNNAVYGLQTLLGDGVVLYRCYVVWGRFDVIILPFMAWLASFGMVCWILTSLSRGTAVPVEANEIVILYATTLAANLSGTLLLAFRIWKADQNARKLNSSHGTLRPILVVILESGALYTITLIMAMITILHFLAMEYVVNAVIPSIISITFSMVFIRVGLTRTREDLQTRGQSLPLSNIEFGNPRPGGSNQLSSSATMGNSTISAIRLGGNGFTADRSLTSDDLESKGNPTVY